MNDESLRCEDTPIDDNTDDFLFLLRMVQEEVEAAKTSLQRVDALIATITKMYDELETEDECMAHVLDSFSCFELLGLAINKLMVKRTDELPN